MKAAILKSRKILFEHYRELVTEEAKEWFSLTSEDARKLLT